MGFNLFLDDERFPSDTSPRIWCIARSFDEAASMIERLGMPEFISFDHDLGEGKSGYDLAHWLVDRHLDGTELPPSFDYVVHSMNNIGAENIDRLLDSFLRHLGRRP